MRKRIQELKVGDLVIITFTTQGGERKKECGFITAMGPTYLYLSPTRQDRGGFLYSILPESGLGKIEEIESINLDYLIRFFNYSQ
jgi:hypothetical protein